VVLCDRYIFTAFARDTVRGCPTEWVRQLYGFAALPDLTFFFKAPLEVSLNRILEGRPELKYFEAGMDLRLSTDPYESFRVFQGRLLEQYLAMSTEFGFLVIDADRPVEVQQSVVRQLVAARIDLAAYHVAPPAAKGHAPRKRRATSVRPPASPNARTPAESWFQNRPRSGSTAMASPEWILPISRAN
jgi:dTMP kinase